MAFNNLKPDYDWPLHGNPTPQSYTYVGSGISGEHRYTKSQFEKEFLHGAPTEEVQALIKKHLPEYLL